MKFYFINYFKILIDSLLAVQLFGRSLFTVVCLVYMQRGHMQVCRSTCIACIIETSMIKSITRGVSRKCTRGMLKYWRMRKILTMLPRIPDQIVTREDSVAS